MPAAARTEVLGSQGDQPLYLGGEVVGAEVEVRADRAVGLVETLEEQLDRRAEVVMPLPRELAGRRVDPPGGQQGAPEATSVGCR